MVDFWQTDFLTAALAEKKDLVLCRNLVFTYFKGERLRAACSRLYQILHEDGVLMTGRKEHLGAEGEEFFRPLSGTDCFYGKRAFDPRGLSICEHAVGIAHLAEEERRQELLRYIYDSEKFHKPRQALHDRCPKGFYPCPKDN